MRKFVITAIGITIMSVVALGAYRSVAAEGAAAPPDDIFLDEGGDLGDSSADAVPPMPATGDEAAPFGMNDTAPAAPTETASEPPAQAAKVEKTKKPEKHAEKKKPGKTNKQAKAKVGKSGGKSRSPSSVNGANRLVTKDCPMHGQPSADSPVVATIKGNRKIWVEDAQGGWFKGYRKNGHGFLNKDCF